ncbi:MAG: [NiFe]-hydrogenase assembly chaperone HybE [Filomicrobium sp.]
MEPAQHIAQQMAERLEACFRAIETERMAGIPILNPAVEVEAVGMREWQGQWLCVLVTPWFINVMLLPDVDEDAQAPQESIRVGSKRSFSFPGGQFEFIHGNEAAIGSYWACSLFSPVLEFGDHETAVATASASLEVMFEESEDASQKEQEMAMIWAGELPEQAPAEETEQAQDQASKNASDEVEEAPAIVSRRAFLRGKTREALP